MGVYVLNVHSTGELMLHPAAIKHGWLGNPPNDIGKWEIIKLKANISAMFDCQILPNDQKRIEHLWAKIRDLLDALWCHLLNVFKDQVQSQSYTCFMVPSKRAEIELDAGPLFCGLIRTIMTTYDNALVEMGLQIKR